MASVGVTWNGVPDFPVLGCQFDDATAGKLSYCVSVDFLPRRLMLDFLNLQAITAFLEF
jgi:hypothetical protein